MRSPCSWTTSLVSLDSRELAPELVSLVQIADLAGTLVLIVVFVAASAGVANTMLMATYERTRELGMLLALGTSPSRIVRMIFAESIVLGLVGALLGSALALAVVAATHRTGIDYAMLTGGGPSELSFAGMRWSLRFYPALGTVDVLRAVIAVVLTSIVASIWPALRAARLQPVQALRA
jgi:ABC-type antimicrobial peptide transport system permease subunit